MNANPILLQKKYVRNYLQKKWGFLLKQHWVFFIIHSCIS